MSTSWESSSARLERGRSVRGLDRLQPRDLVRGEVVPRHEAVALLHEREQRLRHRALVERARPQPRRSRRTGEPRLIQAVALLEQPPSGRRSGALAQGHHPGEHGEALGMGERHGDARPRQAQRRLDEPLPGKDAGASPELVEARRHTGDRACRVRRSSGRAPRRKGRRAPRAPAMGRTAEPGHGDEEVEDPRLVAAGIEPRRVATAQDPRHTSRSRRTEQPQRLRRRPCRRQRGSRGPPRRSPGGRPLRRGYGHLC